MFNTYRHQKFFLSFIQALSKGGCSSSVFAVGPGGNGNDRPREKEASVSSTTTEGKNALFFRVVGPGERRKSCRASMSRGKGEPTNNIGKLRRRERALKVALIAGGRGRSFPDPASAARGGGDRSVRHVIPGTGKPSNCYPVRTKEADFFGAKGKKRKKSVCYDLACGGEEKKAPVSSDRGGKKKDRLMKILKGHQ